jgi:hypothetical protein
VNIADEVDELLEEAQEQWRYGDEGWIDWTQLRRRIRELVEALSSVKSGQEGR